MQAQKPVRFLRGEELKAYRKDLERRKKLYEENCERLEEQETKAFDNLLGFLDLKDSNQNNQGE